MQNSEKMLTPDQAAERLNVPIKTVRQWLRNGTLHGVKEDNRWQIEESDVDRLLEEQKRRARADRLKGEEEPEGEVSGMLFRVLGGERPRK